MGTLSLRITRSELARTLALLRVARGWSQQEVAGASGLSAALVSTAENASALPPSTHSLEVMVEAMGFPLLRELDAEVRRQDARPEDPAWTREMPTLFVEPGQRAAERRSFPGPHTTNWTSTRFARR
jgi:transcriptional regulator with XRE-family HTH domain